MLNFVFMLIIFVISKDRTVFNSACVRLEQKVFYWTESLEQY